MNGYSTNTYCACNKSVTENLRHFILIYPLHATSWTRQSFDVSEVKIELRGMAGKFVDTICIFNRKRYSVKMNIAGFAKIFHEQIDEIL